MTYIVSIFIFLINLVFRKANFKKIIIFITILLLIFFFGGIYNNADNANYIFSYDYIKNNGLFSMNSSSIVWQCFEWVFIKLGFSFEIFRFGVGTIGLILIYKTIIRYTTEINFVILLYFIFPFIIDIIQIRNFFAACILIYSFKYILDTKIIKSLVAVIIASCIHSSIILFIPFIFITRISIKKLLRIAWIVTPIFIFLSETSFFQYLLKLFLGDTDIASNASLYLTKAHWGFLYLWALQFLFVLLIYKIHNALKDIKYEKFKINNFVEIVYKLNIYLIIISFPLIIFNGNFTRIFRDIFVLNYIVLSFTFLLNKTKRSLFVLGGMIIILLYLFSSIGANLNLETVIYPFFNNNSFFEIFDNAF